MTKRLIDKDRFKAAVPRMDDQGRSEQAGVGRAILRAIAGGAVLTECDPRLVNVQPVLLLAAGFVGSQAMRRVSRAPGCHLGRADRLAAMVHPLAGYVIRIHRDTAGDSIPRDRPGYPRLQAERHERPAGVHLRRLHGGWILPLADRAAPGTALGGVGGLLAKLFLFVVRLRDRQIRGELSREQTLSTSAVARLCSPRAGICPTNHGHQRNVSTILAVDFDRWLDRRLCRVEWGPIRCSGTRTP